VVEATEVETTVLEETGAEAGAAVEAAVDEEPAVDEEEAERAGAWSSASNSLIRRCS
jgi:hypothetical protein